MSLDENFTDFKTEHTNEEEELWLNSDSAHLFNLHTDITTSLFQIGISSYA